MLDCADLIESLQRMVKPTHGCRQEECRRPGASNDSSECVQQGTTPPLKRPTVQQVDKLSMSDQKSFPL